MSDMKFGLIFEVRGLDAARKEIEALKNGQREVAAQKEAQASAGQKATEAARREIEANKELARTKAVQNELARAESARAERDLRRRAAAERGLATDLRRARSLEIAETRRQIQAEEVKRVAQAKAAREERLRYLERRRLVQAEENARIQAERSVEAERRRADERIASSISKRTGRPIQEIVNEMNRAGQAADIAGQKAARAESRWRRLANTMRNTRWGRVTGAATAELGKSIAKSVADGIGKGIKEAASSARVNGIMGGRPGGGLGVAAKELSWNAIMGGVNANQAGLNAELQMKDTLSADQVRMARMAAEEAWAGGGQRSPLTDFYDASRELANSGVVADKGLLAAFRDAAVARGNNTSVADVARDYAEALKRKDISGFAERMGGAIASGEDGKQTLKFWQGGQEISRPITPGSEAMLMRELLAKYAGRAAEYAATPQGMWDTAMTQGQHNIATAMEEPFRKATEWMQRFNEAMAGFDGGAAGFGKKIVEGMDQAEKLVLSISGGIRDMIGPINQVVDGLGGWKTVVGGLVVLNVAGWFAGAAAGIRAVAGASALLAASPAGRVLTGLGVAAYALKEAWSTDTPEPGSLKANARAEVQAIKDAMGSAWRWMNTPLNGPGLPAAPAGPAAEVAKPAGPAAEIRPADAAGPAREALALMAQIPAAAQQMAQEVTAIFAAMNLHAQGVAMMETLAAGIRAGSGAVTGAVREVTQAMRDYLPHSPAKVGPLSDLDRVRFSETLASAIRPDPAIAAVRAVAAGMAGALPAAAALPVAAADVPVMSRPAGGGIHINYKPQLSLPEGANRSDFEQLLEEHSRKLIQLVEDAARRRDELAFK